MSEKEIYEEREKRVKELLDKIEKDKESFDDYQIMLEILEDIKCSSISDIGEKRNNTSIIGLAVVIRGYENLIADSKAPYDKFRFRDEMNYLYEIVSKELKKSSSFIRNEQRIQIYLRKLWGKEEFKDFCKKYDIRNISLPVQNVSFWMLSCLLFVLIFLLLIVFFYF
ncbi:MAG: hypothetical protein HWN80_04975 [Candidatus Lokiarchaeota archaeon]|nr:hypothetical protein [Candidatus Lokiarchaeota archaeon]